jgi:hypothetical protein
MAELSLHFRGEGTRRWTHVVAEYSSPAQTHTERSRSPQPLLLKDLWCLELNLIGSWRHLPDHPETRSLLDTTMRAHSERAYLFQGRKTYIWVFDLVREEWCKQPTTWRGGAWPYLNHDCDECALEVLDGVLYAFGGTDRRSDLGTNILVALDLSTYEWTHLGGVSQAVPTIRTPTSAVSRPAGPFRRRSGSTSCTAT